MGSRQVTAVRRRLMIWAVLLASLAVSVGLLTLPAADLSGPTATDRHITHLVTLLLEREHLSKRSLDDVISQRALDSFLKSLDPMKRYFYQSDIDQFMQYRSRLDDMLKERDTSFSYLVFNRFLQRVDERMQMIDQLLEMQHDFSADEELVVDRDLAHYPRDAAEAFERWRKRIKYDLLVLKADKIEGQAAKEKLKKRYHSFAKRMHQFDSDELLELYLTSFTTSFDPHTTFMSRSTLENFRINLGLELEGIGAALKSEDGQTIVTKIIPGGAADKHGKLKVEDRIVSVGQGTDGEMVDVVDMKLSDVVDMIRGPAGTVVRLGVVSPGETETKIYTITRARIELKDSEARGVVFEEGKQEDGTAYKIGVIELPGFYMDMEGAREGLPNFKSTTRDMRKILNQFNDEGVDALILDLRRNGGGSLTEAINCTGLFIDRGPVVQVKDQNGRIRVYDDLDPGMVWSKPLVVLISKFSASASEILAGAIQDYHRGLIVGDVSTHGKGTVQSLLDLGSQLFRIPNPPNWGALKITMQQFYRPDGDSTQKRGVLADIVLPSLSSHMDVAESDLDYAIDFDRIPPAHYQTTEMVNDELIRQLRSRSQNRLAQSEEFQKLVKNIERYREQKKQKTVSLNEKAFFAARAEIDAEKEDEKVLEEQQNGDDQVVERDFYFNEVLAITVDYLQLLNSHRIAQAN